MSDFEYTRIHPSFANPDSVAVLEQLEAKRSIDGIKFVQTALNLGQLVGSAPVQHSAIQKTHAVLRWPRQATAPLYRRHFDMVRTGAPPPQDPTEEVNSLIQLLLDARIDPDVLELTRKRTARARQELAGRYGSEHRVSAALLCAMTDTPYGIIQVGKIAEAGPNDGGQTAELWHPDFADPQPVLKIIQQTTEPLPMLGLTGVF